MSGSDMAGIKTTSCVIVVGLLFVTSVSLRADESIPAKAKPKVGVDSRYKLREDFSAFSDLLPEAERRKQIADGAKVAFMAGVIGHRVLNIGSLRVRDGRLAAFDGATMNGGLLKGSVPNGDYPVLLGAQMHQKRPDDNGEQPMAFEHFLFAKVELARRPVTRWERAVFEKRADRPDVRDRNTFGVDSGTAAVSDGKSFRSIEQAMDPDVNEDIMRQIERQLGFWTHRHWGKAKFKDDAEMIRWGCFGGDGSCPCFWGYDRDGKRVAMLIDFTETTVVKLIDKVARKSP